MPEIPPELAQEKGIQNLDWVVVSTSRGEIESRALVTDRLRLFEIDGRRIYQIGMPWHFFLRSIIVQAGRQSAERPEDYFRITQGD